MRTNKYVYVQEIRFHTSYRDFRYYADKLALVLRMIAVFNLLITLIVGGLNFLAGQPIFSIFVLVGGLLSVALIRLIAKCWETGAPIFADIADSLTFTNAQQHDLRE